MSQAARALFVEEVRRAVREAVTEALNTSIETVDVKGAAALLHTTPKAIYTRYSRGQMPRKLLGRRLVWRKSDLLRSGK